MDSGAAETVIPSSVAKSVKHRRDNGREGTGYRVASGDEIPNKGEKRMVWRSQEGHGGKLTAQVTDVTKGLGSVSMVADAGNWVVFGPKGGYIQQIQGGKRTQFHREGKAYVFDMMVRARNSEDQLYAIEGGASSSRGEEPAFGWQDFLH